MIPSKWTIREFRMHEFLRSLETYEDPLLKNIRSFAREHFVPIVCEETESFLATMIAIKKPDSILEIGSAIGFSTIVMAYSQPKAYITTIESFEERIPILKENLEKAGVSGRIKIIVSDASLALKNLVLAKERYDFIFLDAAKGQYLGWLPDIIDVCSPGAILFSDNVLLGESILESKYLLPHRARSTHERMRNFLYSIKHDERLKSAVIPVGDGVALSVRVKK